MRASLLLLLGMLLLGVGEISWARGCESVVGMPNVCPGRSYIDTDSAKLTMAPPSAPARCQLQDDSYTCPTKEAYANQLAEWRASPSPWQIYYTTDGSTPNSRNGQLYQDNLPVVVSPASNSMTVVVKAIAYANNFSMVSRISTHTYVFANKVAAQNNQPHNAPRRWGNFKKAKDFLEPDYEMDPKVVGSRSRQALAAALKSLPAVSLTLTTDDLFDQACGIYMNPQKADGARADGDEQECERFDRNDQNRWKRRSAMELIVPESVTVDKNFDGTGEPGVQIEGELKIQGGSSRSSWKSKKLSMRIKFKEATGAKTLNYPVFKASTATTKFDTLVFDAHLNFAFSHGTDREQRQKAHYLGDPFTSDLMIAAGNKAPHSRFFNLFLNGIYWGVYDIHERPDEHFAEAYFKADKESFDVVKKTSSDIMSVAGKGLDNWESLLDKAKKLKKDKNYKNLADVLDIDDFIRYMLINFYVANEDWPHHNWYVIYNREAPGSKWRFISWDAEKSLNDGNYNSVDRVDDDKYRDGPGELFADLWKNSDFRDRVFTIWRQLTENGPLKPETATAIYKKRQDELRQGIILESARWGDAYETSGVNEQVANWQKLTANIISEFIKKRPREIKQQLDDF